MRALKSERWTLVEREGRGGQYYSWCGQEHGKKGQGGERVKSCLAGVQDEQREEEACSGQGSLDYMKQSPTQTRVDQKDEGGLEP